MNHQLRTADTIIVNKVDLAGDKLDEVIAQVKETNPFARLLKEIKNDCIRTKGFIKIEGGKTVFVQGVFDEF